MNPEVLLTHREELELSLSPALDCPSIHNNSNLPSLTNVIPPSALCFEEHVFLWPGISTSSMSAAGFPQGPLVSPRGKPSWAFLLSHPQEQLTIWGQHVPVGEIYLGRCGLSQDGIVISLCR